MRVRLPESESDMNAYTITQSDYSRGSPKKRKFKTSHPVRAYLNDKKVAERVKNMIN